MKRSHAIIGLEAYAALLTYVQSLGGVRTDEAKYLLSIPYPHPPFLRGLFNLLESFPGQELLIRFLLASLVVQGVWLLLDTLATKDSLVRQIICLAWLLAAAIVVQAGSVMMAPVTAMQGLFFIWLLSKPHYADKYSALIGLAWLTALFTAYQIVLFIPLVALVFWRMNRPFWVRIALFTVPLITLALYTLTNPLIIASLVVSGGESLSLSARLKGLGMAWLMGGSIVASMAGIQAMLFAKRWDLLATLALVAAYVFLLPHPYYAILFTPLLVAGLVAEPDVFLHKNVARNALVLGSAILIFTHLPSTAPSSARQIARMANVYQGNGLMLIQGSYGHQWQYESLLPVRKYTPKRIPSAMAVVCFTPCEQMQNEEGWKSREVAGREVWLRE